MSASRIGRAVELWRYPVTSIGGERLTSAIVDSGGVESDREYGLIDALTGQPAAPEKEVRWRKALHLRASLSGLECPQIVFPNGQNLALTDPILEDALSDHFGFAVSIAAYQHTKRPLGLSPTRYRHRHFPMHMLTTASLERLVDLQPAAAVDSRRFRPTLLIDTGEAKGFVENGWIGRRLRIGGVQLTAEENTKRCGVTFIAQPGLTEDPNLLRSILRHNNRNLGIYCSIDDTGTVEVGDELFVDV